MKTPMNVMTNMQKKRKKNQKGFSLVELIVVLVIMAILAAALIPSLTGYIRQTRESNAKNEAASLVSASQTIASSAYADPSLTYHGSADVIFASGGNTPTGTGEPANFYAVAKALSEVTGTVTTITVANGIVTAVEYTTTNGVTVNYDVTDGVGAYTVS